MSCEKFSAIIGGAAVLVMSVWAIGKAIAMDLANKQ